LAFRAFWFYHHGDLRASIALTEERARILMKVLGDEHPDTLANQQVLASRYLEMGYYDRAGKILSRIVPIQEKLLGEEHPAYARTLISFAWWFVAQGGNYDQAEEYLKKALSIHENALRKDCSIDTCVLTSEATLHCPMTNYASSLVVLGAFYCDLEEFAR